MDDCSPLFPSSQPSPRIALSRPNEPHITVEELLSKFKEHLNSCATKINELHSALSWGEIRRLQTYLNALKGQLVPWDLYKYFLKLILIYIDIVMQFISVQYSDFTKQMHHIGGLLKSVSALFVEEMTCSIFLQRAATKIFDMILLNEYPLILKTQLLRMLNDIIIISNIDIRKDTGNKKTDYLYRLFDWLPTLGEYLAQITVMEVIFNIFAESIRGGRLQYCLVPGHEKLGQELINIDRSNIKIDARKWLNKFNEKSILICSFAYETIQVGDMNCECPNEGDLKYIDFDMKEKIASFYSKISEDNWNRVFILENYVDRVEIQSSKQFIILSILQTNACVSEKPTRQREWNDVDPHMKILLIDTGIIDKLKLVLRMVFGDKFLPPETAVLSANTTDSDNSELLLNNSTIISPEVHTSIKTTPMEKRSRATFFEVSLDDSLLLPVSDEEDESINMAPDPMLSKPLSKDSSNGRETTHLERRSRTLHLEKRSRTLNTSKFPEGTDDSLEMTIATAFTTCGSVQSANELSLDENETVLSKVPPIREYTPPSQEIEIVSGNCLGSRINITSPSDIVEHNFEPAEYSTPVRKSWMLQLENPIEDDFMGGEFSETGRFEKGTELFENKGQVSEETPTMVSKVDTLKAIQSERRSSNVKIHEVVDGSQKNLDVVSISSENTFDKETQQIMAVNDCVLESQQFQDQHTSIIKYVEENAENIPPINVDSDKKSISKQLSFNSTAKDEEEQVAYEQIGTIINEEKEIVSNIVMNKPNQKEMHPSRKRSTKQQPLKESASPMTTFRGKTLQIILEDICKPEKKSRSLKSAKKIKKPKRKRLEKKVYPSRKSHAEVGNLISPQPLEISASPIITYGGKTVQIAPKEQPETKVQTPKEKIKKPKPKHLKKEVYPSSESHAEVGNLLRQHPLRNSTSPIITYGGKTVQIVPNDISMPEIKGQTLISAEKDEETKEENVVDGGNDSQNYLCKPENQECKIDLFVPTRKRARPLPLTYNESSGSEDNNSICKISIEQDDLADVQINTANQTDQEAQSNIDENQKPKDSEPFDHIDLDKTAPPVNVDKDVDQMSNRSLKELDSPNLEKRNQKGKVAKFVPTRKRARPLPMSYNESSGSEDDNSICKISIEQADVHINTANQTVQEAQSNIDENQKPEDSEPCDHIDLNKTAPPVNVDKDFDQMSNKSLMELDGPTHEKRNQKGKIAKFDPTRKRARPLPLSYNESSGSEDDNGICKISIKQADVHINTANQSDQEAQSNIDENQKPEDSEPCDHIDLNKTAPPVNVDKDFDQISNKSLMELDGPTLEKRNQEGKIAMLAPTRKRAKRPLPLSYNGSSGSEDDNSICKISRVQADVHINTANQTDQEARISNIDENQKPKDSEPFDHIDLDKTASPVNVDKAFDQIYNKILTKLDDPPLEKRIQECKIVKFPPTTKRARQSTKRVRPLPRDDPMPQEKNPLLPPLCYNGSSGSEDEKGISKICVEQADVHINTVTQTDRDAKSNMDKNKKPGESEPPQQIDKIVLKNVFLEKSPPIVNMDETFDQMNKTYLAEIDAKKNQLATTDHSTPKKTNWRKLYDPTDFSYLDDMMGAGENQGPKQNKSRQSYKKRKGFDMDRTLIEQGKTLFGDTPVSLVDDIKPTKRQQRGILDISVRPLAKKKTPAKRQHRHKGFNMDRTIMAEGLAGIKFFADVGDNVRFEKLPVKRLQRSNADKPVRSAKKKTPNPTKKLQNKQKSNVGPPGKNIEHKPKDIFPNRSAAKKTPTGPGRTEIMEMGIESILPDPTGIAVESETNQNGTLWGAGQEKRINILQNVVLVPAKWPAMNHVESHQMDENIKVGDSEKESLRFTITIEPDEWPELIAVQEALKLGSEKFEKLLRKIKTRLCY